MTSIATAAPLAWTKNNLLNKSTVSSAKALEVSGLDWEVEKTPALIANLKGTGTITVPDRFGVRRTDTGQPFGVVGTAWHPFQNRDGFSIVDTVISEAGGEVKIVGAGEIKGGRKVWLLAELQDKLFIAGEEYGAMLLFTNGHDGRTSVTCGLIDVRLFCNNQQNFVLGGAASTRMLHIRHTKNAKQAVLEAREILKLRSLRNEELAKQGEWLVQNEMSDAAFDMFLESLMPCKEDEGTPAHTMVTQRRDEIKAIRSNAANLEGIRSSKWGALQSVLEYADHGRKFKTDEAQMVAQFGLGSTALQQRAYDLIASSK